MRVVCIAFGLAFAAAYPVRAQQASATTWTAVAGGALGLYSGALLGTVGSLTPCTQTWLGPGCVRWSAVAAGAVGLTSGLLVGADNRDAVASAATGAGVGLVLGVTAGAVIKPIVQRFSWADVATVGLIGGAIGTAPAGAAIGFAIGGVVGGALLPRIEVPNAIGMALGGLAVGGLTEWVIRAAKAPPDAGVELRLVVPIAVRF